MKNDKYACNFVFVYSIGTDETVRLFIKKDEKIDYIKKDIN